jgi:translocation and assembly module TamB
MQRYRLRARLRRRRQRIALLLGFLVGALYVLVVHTTLVQDALGGALVDAVREELGLDVGISHVSLDLAFMPPALTVSAHEVDITHPEHGKLAHAKRLLVQPSWMGFLRGAFELRRIQLHEPDVRLTIRDGKILNGPRLPEPSDDDEPISLDLPFQRFIVIDGTITVDVDGHVSTLRDLRVDLENDEGSLALFLSTGAIRVEHPDGTDDIESIALAARLPSLESVLLDHFVLSLAEGKVQLDGASVPLPFREEGAAKSVKIDLDLAVLDRVPESVGLPKFTGHLGVDGGFEMNEEGPRFDGEVVVSKLFIDDVGVGGLIDLKLEVDAERIRLKPGSEYHVLHDGGHAAVVGTIGLGGTFPVSLDVDIVTLKLERLLWQLGVTPDAIIDWELGGKSKLTGQLLPFSLAGPLNARAGPFILTADAHHVRPRDVILKAKGGRVDGRIGITENGLHFQRMRLDTGRSKANVDFFIGFDDDFWLKLKDGSIDLAEVSPLVGVPIAGRASVDLSIGDTYSNVALHGDYSIENFEFGDMPLGRIHVGQADLEKEGFAVRFHNIRATKGATDYRITDLLLDFEEAFELTAKGTLDRFTLVDIRKILGLEGEAGISDVDAVGKGQVSARFTMGFPDDRPSGTLRLDIATTLDSAEVMEIPFDGGEAKLTLHWKDFDRGVDGMALDLDRVHLTKDGGTLSIGGRLLLGGKLSMDAVIDRIALEGIPDVAALSPELTGNVGGVGRIGGTLDVPHVDLELRLSNVAYANALLGDGLFTVRLADKAETDARPEAAPGCEHAWRGLAGASWRRTLEPRADGTRPPNPPMAWLVCGSAFDGALAADLAIGWSRKLPIRGELSVKELDLTPFLPKDNGQPAGRASITGLLSFTGGGIAGGAGLSGTLALQQVRASFGDVMFGNVGPVRIDVTDGRAVVRRARFGGAGTRLELRGSGTDKALDFRLDGDVDVSALGAVTPLVKGSDGRVALGVRIRGSAEKPIVTGTVRLEDISFFARDLPVPVRDLVGTIRFDDRRILFDEITARVGGGKTRIDGKVDVRGGAIKRYAIDAKFSGVSYSPEEGMSLALGGDTRLKWQEGDALPTLAGTVNLERMRYTRGVNLSPTIGELNRPKRESVRDPYAAQEHLNLDLVLRHQRPLEIRNNVADVDVVVDEQGGAFRIVGTDARPGAYGSLRISRGTMRFRSSDFIVRDGTIVFASANEIDPRFDVTATTQIIRADVAGPMWRIFLRAHGTMDAFQLDATSEPSLTQQDIALLLTIGMTGAEAQSVQANAFSGAALEALSAVTGVDDELSSALGVIDDISLTTAYHPVTNRPEPQVTVSKRLSDQVRLRASTGLASETRDVTAALQWRLGQQTSLELQYDNIDRESASSFGNVGVDMRWRLEFE